MPIDEKQLDTWSHQGSIQQSSQTYNSIKNVLESDGTPYADKAFKVFLQGSYGNDTNIYAESDVDIVIKLDDCFQSDLSELAQEERDAYSAAYPNATYTHVEFKADVLDVLNDAYGGDVAPGDKAIAIAANGNRRKADVIVAIQYRRYHKFRGIYEQNYTEGICFWNKAGSVIANFPKQHSANLTSRHQASGTWLKPMVRVLKNLRNRCIADGLLAAGRAPSYYLEGLLYNVPSSKFESSYGDCFVNGFRWLQGEANKEELVCANEQYYLLRDNSHTCWEKADGEAFIGAAIDLWNEW